MSWTAPPTVVAGQLMTAVFWNLAFRDNTVVLRSGGIAIASQAAGDFISAGTSTQWARFAGVEKRAAHRAAGAWETKSIIDFVYPVGIIYKSTSSVNPGTTFGVGTWTAYGVGRVLIGFDAAQTEFDSPGETGGEKLHTLTTAEMPSHSHATVDPGHFHLAADANDRSGGGPGIPFLDDYSGQDGNHNSSFSATGVTLQNAGSGGSHNNMSPYVTVYMWKRTA